MINKEVEKWRYALALFTGRGFLEIIQKYPNTEQLETGYRDWKKFASDRNITKPVPIELLTEDYRVLNDILYAHDVILN